MKNRFKQSSLIFFSAILLIVSSSSAQLSFISGVDALAGPDANYAAVAAYDFSNAGGSGNVSSGTGNNLFGVNHHGWTQSTLNITVTYAPNYNEVGILVGSGGVYTTINIPSAPANELEITVANTGIGDLILNLTSINAVANGGTGYGPMTAEVVGGSENFAPGTTFSAANGTTLQAYLDSPTLFNSEFTLNGTITLDAPASSTDYGDGLNSLVEFNLTTTPEPSTWALMAGGTGLLVVLRQQPKKKRV